MASRTVALLWLPRLSIERQQTLDPIPERDARSSARRDDDVAGAQRRDEHLLDMARKLSPLIAPSISIGASIPESLRPETKVVVRQWPCGTPARRRSPLGARPRSRAILVLSQVSSMKIRRSGSRSGCPSHQASRAAATSSRSCSAAWADFF